MGQNLRMELVRTRILTGTCPECGTRLTGQEHGVPNEDETSVEWVLVKQWCYNGCLSMTEGPVIPIQPIQPKDEPEPEPRRHSATHLIIGR
jgi:hypothetical protein